MEKPRCRVCGEAHWSSEPHKWKGETVSDRLVEQLIAGGRETRREVELNIGMSVRCACGCGVTIPIKPRYATAACRQRASRARRGK